MRNKKYLHIKQAILMGTLLVGGQAIAGDVVSPYEIQPNQSFLVNTRMGLDENDQLKQDIQSRLYGDKLSARMTSEYTDLTRPYEMRSRTGATSVFEDQLQAKRDSDFGRYVMRNSISYQTTEGLKKAEKTSDEIRTFHHAQETFQNVVQNSSNFKLSDDFKFGTKTDLPGERGKVWMKSNFVNANFDAVVGNGFSLTPAQPTAPTNMESDHYLASLSRDMGVWGLQGGMTYGLNTTKMNQTISKALTPNLSAEVATTRGMNPSRSGMSVAEESIRMSYGLHF